MSTIRSSSEIDTIFRTARRAANPLVIALVAQTPPGRGQDGRVAFIAGKKLGGAVVRNRCKRVLRAAVPAVGGPWPGFDIALIAREKTAQAPHQELEAAISQAVSRAGVTR